MTFASTALVEALPDLALIGVATWFFLEGTSRGLFAASCWVRRRARAKARKAPPQRFEGLQ